MNCKQKVCDLKAQIMAALSPRIDSDYWLLEVPHYNNVGDTLIWQGELDFLEMFPYRRKGMASFDSMKMPLIGTGDLVLFQGGGNFGDLWPECHEYRKKILRQNPRCRFLVFPQTVCWEHDENLRDDARFFAAYDCTICARDQRSYDILKSHFKNEILLVSDMAFCMDIAKWNRGKFQAVKPFVLKRADKEFRQSSELEAALSGLDADVDDWFAMTHRSLIDLWRYRIYNRRRYMLDWAYELYMYYIYRPYLIRAGVQQLMAHTDIYTTRLHACILSILLCKDKITFFDNSYGKNSGFYDTWLQDCDNVNMVHG